MKNLKTTIFEGDVELTNPGVAGLDASFDEVIRGIPASLIHASDDFALDPEFSKDPLKVLKGIRDRCGYIVQGDNGVYGGVPLANSFGIDFSRPHFSVFGIEEHDAIVTDLDGFKNAGAYGLLGDAQHMAHGEFKGTIPTLTDGEEHDELRALYDTFLNQNVMAQRSQKLIKPIGEWLIDRLVTRLRCGDDVCIVRDLALPLTYKAISTLLGIPQERLVEFASLSEKFFTSGVDPARGLEAGDELYDFFFEQTQSRTQSPQQDLISYLALLKKDGERALSDSEVAITARFILPGGIETTWRGLSLTILALLSHPDQYDAICQNRKLVRRAVEEGFRYAPSGFILPRLASKDMEIAGVKIPKGSHITSYQGVLNRDPRRWDNPDVFDIHRKFYSHRTFNAGDHACVGQHLARIEVMTCLELLAELLPNLRLAEKPEELEVRGLQNRTPISVPVKLV